MSVLSVTGAPVRQYDIAANGAITPKSVPEVVTGAREATSIEVTPDGRRALAVDLLNARAAILDVGTGGRLENHRAIPATFSPSHVAVSRDSRSVYLADAGTIRQYDLAVDGTLTPKTPASVSVPNVGRLTVSPDGRTLYAQTGMGSASILRFRIEADGRLTPTGSPVPAPDGPLAITPDGKNLFTYQASGGTTTIHQFAVAPDGTLTPHSPPTIAFSGTATGIAVAPDGGSLYVADFTNHRVVQYSVASDGTLAPKAPTHVATGDFPTTLAVTPLADLAVSVSTSPEPTSADEEVTYTITVTNEIGAPEGGATVTTALPSGLTLVGASTPHGTCTTSGPVECEIAPLAQGESTTVAVRARAVVTGTHHLGASVTGLAPDPDAADNTDSASVSVVPRAIATTTPASDVASDRATLNGVATPSAPGTAAWFEIGPTDAYGTTTPTVAIADGSPPSVVSATVAGLAPATTYHYRLVVTDGTGATIRGADRTFTTREAPAPPQEQDPAPPPEPERIETIRTVYVPIDQTPPRISGVALAPRALRMRLSEAATVRATISVRRTREMRRGGKARRISRWVVVHRGSVETANAGTVKLAIPKRLAPARYRITVRAADAAGNTARTLTATRTLGKARRP